MQSRNKKTVTQTCKIDESAFTMSRNARNLIEKVMKSSFQRRTSGNAYSDVDISPPELNGDSRCRELERKNCKPPERVIPANSKATSYQH
jgi:hypothetical protein